MKTKTQEKKENIEESENSLLIDAPLHDTWPIEAMKNVKISSQNHPTIAA